MRRYLIVANQTLAGSHLIETVRELNERGPCSFYVVVPATPPHDHAWSEGEARDIAHHRLERALGMLRGIGADADGEVGDERPIYAIQDVLAERQVDEIILSTLPAGISRWLKRDLPHHIEVEFELPVTHIIGQPEPAPRA